MKDKYYLINDSFAIMTDLKFCSLKKVMKEQFNIDVFSIKSLTLEEYINFINTFKNTKFKVKFFKMEEK